MLVCYPKLLSSPIHGFASIHFICMIVEDNVVSCQKTYHKLYEQFTENKQTNKQRNCRLTDGWTFTNHRLCNNQDFSSLARYDLSEPSIDGLLTVMRVPFTMGISAQFGFQAFEKT